MSGNSQGDQGSTAGDEQENPLVKGWNFLKSDIDTQSIREVVNIENGRPKIDPKKAKELAEKKHRWSVKGGAGGAIVGGVISLSGFYTIPVAAVGAALGFVIDRNLVDNVEEIEKDFKEVLDAIENEEEVDLSRLAMITHIKKKTLADDYLPYLEEQNMVEFDEENDVVIYSESVLKQAASYFQG